MPRQGQRRHAGDLAAPYPDDAFGKAGEARPHWYMEEVNDLIARQCALYPGRFVPMAGLPQTAGDPIAQAGARARCVTKMMGFHGCLINPDHLRELGREAPPASLLVSALREDNCELDVVGPHPIGELATGRPASPYSLPHFFINEERRRSTGDQSRPCSAASRAEDRGRPRRRGDPLSGRTFGSAVRRPPRFLDRLRRLYFDTVLYSRARRSRLLIKGGGSPIGASSARRLPERQLGDQPETSETPSTRSSPSRDCDFITEDPKTAIPPVAMR